MGEVCWRAPQKGSLVPGWELARRGCFSEPVSETAAAPGDEAEDEAATEVEPWWSHQAAESLGWEVLPQDLVTLDKTLGTVLAWRQHQHWRQIAWKSQSSLELNRDFSKRPERWEIYILRYVRLRLARKIEKMDRITSYFQDLWPKQPKQGNPSKKEQLWTTLEDALKDSPVLREEWRGRGSLR